MSTLSERQLALIATQPVCRLATANADGSLHLVPVCPVVVDGAVYADLLHARQTEANLRRTPRATVLFDEYSSSWDKLWGVQLRCRAEFLTEDDPAWGAVWQRFQAHYPQHAAFAWQPRRLVRFTPERVLSWGT